MFVIAQLLILRVSTFIPTCIVSISNVCDSCAFYSKSFDVHPNMHCFGIKCLWFLSIFIYIYIIIFFPPLPLGGLSFSSVLPRPSSLPPPLSPPLSPSPRVHTTNYTEPNRTESFPSPHPPTHRGPLRGGNLRGSYIYIYIYVYIYIYIYICMYIYIYLYIPTCSDVYFPYK